MFIGHFSVALAAGASRKSPSLGTLFVASQLVDLGFFSLMIAGIEKMRFLPGATVMNPMDLYHMPYTHGLIGASLWALGFGAAIWLLTRRTAAAVIGAAVVFSHWLLDLLTHRPDLVMPNGSKVGLGLWNYPMIEMPLEIGMTLTAAWLYARATEPKRSAGRWSLLWLIAILLIMQAVNWFGPVAPVAGHAVAVEALVAYAVAIGLAIWVATTRRFKDSQMRA